VIAYDPRTGNEIWRAKCLGGQVVPSPIFANGLVYAVSPDGSLAAIRADGRGDVTQTHIVWSADEGLPSICSPVAGKELIWLVDSGGLVTCYDAMHGAKIGANELENSFQASPTIANDLLYLLGDDGTLHIVKADKQCSSILSRPSSIGRRLTRDAARGTRLLRQLRPVTAAPVQALTAADATSRTRMDSV